MFDKYVDGNNKNVDNNQERLFLDNSMTFDKNGDNNLVSFSHFFLPVNMF